MKRKIIGAGLFCLVLFAAILAGYWDMLSTEKLKIVRDEASESVGEIADIVREGSVPSASAPPAQTPSAAVPVSEAPPALSESVTAPTGTAAVSPAETPDPAPVVPPQPEPATADAPPPAVPPAPAGDAPPAAAGAQTPPASVTQVEPGPTDAAGSPPATPSPAGQTPEKAPASLPDAAAMPPEPLVSPTFDIVRVEPDGSVVLAGRAPAGSAIVLLDGTTRIGGDTASASGDFVVALDDRLKVGEHQLTLQATAPDGRATTSAETAIVNIPEKGRENELLAMVQSPDSPSRLISLPSASSAESVPPSGAADLASDEAPTEPDSAASPEAAGEAPLLPSASSATDGAADLTLPVAPARPALPAVSLAVEAVEIEGDRIYVAGRSAGAASVRVYIDNDFLATAPKVTADRFLVTATVSVHPGEHVVRADALDNAGTVIARVEVPFVRPEGRAMSAILAPSLPTAPAAATVATADPAAGAAPAASNDPAASMAPAAGQAQMATRLEPSGVSNGDEPAGAGDAASVPPAPAAPNSVQATVAPPVAAPSPTPAEQPVSAPVPAPATAALAAAEPVPSVEPPVAAAAERPAAAPSAGADDTRAGTASDAAATGAATAPMAAAAPTPPDGQITVVRQPALEPAEARVIIRRGDTLWRISRETYGRGARYTVIYLANGDQIRDPDRIYPGQVFRTPKDE
ncbi:hypothetical protein Sa4125_15580 [Aureimonas sp. SA4125]|uniref:LysM peptidoglycan-binding domain-containing protein n=1 Tax=Aureimonas sp. SA4125 TaxID=2826993 RepID=UPI001CC4A57C|nr:LysM peptidoglycan-binding domain-containing protein [Aureimonas sp. SA4125]BDA84016.1 hypothetical protein Sa4125_15580 [Aureimonas sp. SA4125]